MSAQKSLPLSVEVDLSRFPRLAFGLAYIREHGPVSAEEVGRAWRLHRRLGFSAFANNEIGKSLRKRGLVRYRQKAGWYAVTPEGKPWRAQAGEVEVDWGGFGDA
jgi:hypothetical protein